MNTYLTRNIRTNYSGKKIKAHSFDEAESKCPDGYAVIGKLVMVIPAPEFDRILMN